MAEEVYCLRCGRTRQAFSLQYPGPYCRCEQEKHLKLTDMTPAQLRERVVELTAELQRAASKMETN